jgi:hypothetical protein
MQTDMQTDRLEASRQAGKQARHSRREQSGPNHSACWVSPLSRPTVHEESHTQPNSLLSSQVTPSCVCKHRHTTHNDKITQFQDQSIDHFNDAPTHLRALVVGVIIKRLSILHPRHLLHAEALSVAAATVRTRVFLASVSFEAREAVALASGAVTSAHIGALCGGMSNLGGSGDVCPREARGTSEGRAVGGLVEGNIVVGPVSFEAAASAGGAITHPVTIAVVEVRTIRRHFRGEDSQYC